MEFLIKISNIGHWRSFHIYFPINSLTLSINVGYQEFHDGRCALYKLNPKPLCKRSNNEKQDIINRAREIIIRRREDYFHNFPVNYYLKMLFMGALATLLSFLCYRYPVLQLIQELRELTPYFKIISIFGTSLRFKETIIET